MRGVGAARESGDEVDVFIVSAFYGLVHGDAVIDPYDVTFSSMSKAQRVGAARRLRLQERVIEVMRDYDAALVALGEDYCENIHFRGLDYPAPTVRLVARPADFSCPVYREVAAGMPQCPVYGCGIISLKGEVAGRILERGVHRDPELFLGLYKDHSCLV